MTPSAERAAFETVPTQFVFEFAVLLFDRSSAPREVDQRFERGRGIQIEQVVLPVALGHRLSECRLRGGPHRSRIMPRSSRLTESLIASERLSKHRSKGRSRRNGDRVTAARILWRGRPRRFTDGWLAAVQPVQGPLRESSEVLGMRFAAASVHGSARSFER
jgi:hypothetical protein